MMIESNHERSGELATPAQRESVTCHLGELLRAIRQQHGLKQLDVEGLSREIAGREQSADFVVTNWRLSAIENGRALPGPAKLLALAQIYGLDVQGLVKLWATKRKRVDLGEAA